MLTDFDIAREAGGPMRSVIKEFTGIQAQETGVFLQIPRPGAFFYVYDLPLRGLEQSIRSSESPK